MNENASWGTQVKHSFEEFAKPIEQYRTTQLLRETGRNIWKTPSAKGPSSQLASLTSESHASVSGWCWSSPQNSTIWKRIGNPWLNDFMDLETQPSNDHPSTFSKGHANQHHEGRNMIPSDANLIDDLRQTMWSQQLCSIAFGSNFQSHLWSWRASQSTNPNVTHLGKMMNMIWTCDQK